MTSLGVQKFGSTLQQLNPQRIVVISWELADWQNRGPLFHFFNRIEEFIDYLYENYHYMLPFIESDADSAKENAIIQFDEDEMKLRVIFEEEDSTIYQFYQPQAWAHLKEILRNG